MSRPDRMRQLLDSLPTAHLAEQPDLARLDLVTSLLEEAEHYRAELVARAREHGASWTEIGQNIGTTKQAAQQRYGTKPSRVTTNPGQEPLPGVSTH